MGSTSGGLLACVVAGMAAVTLFLTVPLAQAETFKSADVLGWASKNQSFYFRTSVGMAGLVAARNDKRHSDCVDRWYFSDVKKSDAVILETMRKYPEHHPQAIILALLQKACGSFTY